MKLKMRVIVVIIVVVIIASLAVVAAFGDNRTKAMQLGESYAEKQMASDGSAVVAMYKDRTISSATVENANKVAAQTNNEELMKKSETDIINETIMYMILDDEVEERGIVTTKEELDEYMAWLKSSYDEYPETKKYIDEFCQGAGITIDEYWETAEDISLRGINRRKLEKQFMEDYCKETGTSSDDTAKLNEAYKAYCDELFEAHKDDIVYY